MVSRRLAFVLIDGIGDVALPQLEDLTGLQVAHTPILDTIAGASPHAHAFLLFVVGWIS